MKRLIALVLFAVVPLVIVFSRFTTFKYMPLIATPAPQQWNIQYFGWVVPFSIAALLGIVAWRRYRPDKVLFTAVVWNGAWALLSLCAVITLWGEKV